MNNKKKKVAIIGAGISGLVCAYELNKQGYEVELFEARDRIGGRIHTLRSCFDHNLYAEAGAMAISDRDKYVHRYVEEFNLPLASRLPLHQSLSFYLDQQIIPIDAMPQNCPYPLNPQEQSWEMYNFWIKVLRPLLATISPEDLKELTSEKCIEYDKMSFRELLHKLDLSPGAIKLMQTSLLHLIGGSFDELSALSIMIYALKSTHSKQSFTIIGGNDQLCKHLAKPLQNHIHLNSPVTHIDQTSKQIVLTTAHQQYTADHLILSVPLPLLNQITFTPTLSQEKQTAIAEIPYTTISRHFIQYEKHPEEKINMVIADDPHAWLEDHTFHQQSTRGILEVHTSGKSAKHYQQLSPEKRKKHTLSKLKPIYPKLETLYEKERFICWDDEPYSRGAYCYYKPGQITDHLPHIKKPEGKLHFCGEHTSLYFASINGAIESAHRVLEEITNPSKPII